MQADFWHQRWASSQIGFHQQQVNPYLLRFWPDLMLAAQSRVLVPLCGKSLDLRWLVEQGYQVLGVELSQKAIEAFFSEQRISAAISQRGAFKVYASEGIELWCGDIFALDAEDVADCTALYDRAALIALPPVMRERYVAHLGSVLPAQCRGLLITLDYDQSKIDGPPFAVADEEVQRLLGPIWSLETWQIAEVERNAKQLERGVERMEERIYRLERS
jgi:thiopurine S-methyltransferase